MNVSIIIPHRPDTPINVPVHGAGDEVIVVEGYHIGANRLEGARRAVNEWLIQLDADGEYPEDYVENVKQVILSGEYPNGFQATREGGFWYQPAWNQEAGIVIRRSVLLEVAEGYSDGRNDIGPLLDVMPRPEGISYYHGLTTGERDALALTALAALGGVLWWRFKK